jgi:cytoskeletal protein RodZ
MDQIATDIGSRLRQARETRGLSLRDIANTTKISTAALHAIERNDFARLPGGVFSRAYVRAFAEAVGLDADELTREYRARFETEIPAEPLLRHEADWKHRLRLACRFPAVILAIVGILICGSLILDRGQVPDEASDGRMLSAAEADLPDDTAQTDDSDGTEDVAFANAAVADIRAPSLRLELRTKGPCWVSAVADGERVVYRLMQPGERTLVEARVAITLRVGDAGAVGYSINGATGRPLGRNGEAVTVRITNDSLGRLYAEPASPGSPKRVTTRIGRGRSRNWEANGQRAAAA